MAAARPASALALLAALLASAACAPEPERHDLPREWYAAQVDEAGGRFLADANAALRRFQQEVRRSGDPVLYPHYHGSRTVVLAIKQDFIESGTRRRLGLLLEHEARDPELSIVAITDGEPQEIAAALGEGVARRVTLVHAGDDRPSHVTYQFLRDYAPLVRARPSGDGFVTDALLLYRGSTLNKMVDPRLGIRIDRSAEETRRKSALSRALADLYSARLGHDVARLELDVRMDGGNLLSDGRGSCFATGILVAKNRGNAPFVERELREKAGCRRTVFLAAPQRLDFIQHVDTLLAFADAETAILSMPTRYESDRIHTFQNVRRLLELGYRVHLLPRPTASITYTNLLITPGRVYVPQYTMYEVESQRQQAIQQRMAELERRQATDLLSWYLQQPVETRLVRGGEALEADNRRALEVMARLFPDREIVPVDSDETNRTRGSWHCLSHELPERLAPAGS